MYQIPLLHTKPHSKESKYIDKYEKSLKAFRCVPTSLKSIIKDKYIDQINDIVLTINEIDCHAYHFFKLYCITVFNNTQMLPDIDLELIVEDRNSCGVR